MKYVITNNSTGETKTANVFKYALAAAKMMLEGEKISDDIISICDTDGNEYEAFMTDNGEFVVEEL